MIPSLVLCFAMLVLNSCEVQFGLAAVQGQEFCLGYRTDSWTVSPFTLKGRKYRVNYCDTAQQEGAHGYQMTNLIDHSPATLVDEDCNLTSIPDDGVLFVKAPFSPQLSQKLNNSRFTAVIQVRGDIKGAIWKNKAVNVSPVHFGKIYWGAVIMYFVALIYVSIGAVIIEGGRVVVEKHAGTSPLARLPFCQTRVFLILFLVSFMLLLTVFMFGYMMRPVLFQPVFALFLCTLGVVGFYHIVFPLIVFLAVRHIRIINKTYWAVERVSVIISGTAIFLVWVNYRSEPNIWPLQLLLLCCVGVVPLRYAPADCIKKMIVITVIGVFFSVVQRYILPVAAGAPPNYVDIVTVQARIPDTIDPGPLFPPDFLEGNMLAFRIPLFGTNHNCSSVLDGTFGLMNFVLPAMFIKAAMLTDQSINDGRIVVRNYTVAVVCYLACHIAIFVLSYVTEAPVNSNLFYLPGITIGVLLNSCRSGHLRAAMNPPPPPSQENRPDFSSDMVVYKVTANPEPDVIL